MKTKRSILSFVLVLVLCFSMALSVFANSGMMKAGAYGRLSCYVADAPVGSFVASSTSITQNPDDARLKIEADFSNGDIYTSSFSQESSRGVTSYAPNLPYYIGTSTIGVYTAHSVKDGTVNEPYTYYMYTDFS